MSKKTQQIIMRVIVGILVIGLVLSILSPLLFAATKYTTYKSKKLHMSMKVPTSAKSNIKKTGANGMEMTVNFNYLVRVTYGDIYEDTLDTLNLNSDAVDRSEFYIGSKHFNKTWNTEQYVKKYFKDVLTGNKNDKYTYSISKTTIDGVSGWRCKYKNKGLKSSGYYYLTINNSGLHIMQFDAYLENISKYSSMTNTMKDSFKIMGKVDPAKADKDSPNENQDEPEQGEPEQENNGEEENNNSNYAGFIVAGIGVIILGASVYFYAKQRKYKKMKKNREEYRKNKRKKKRK